MKNGELNTWIRLESGDVVGAVSLKAMYGDDLYPATPNDKTYLDSMSNRYLTKEYKY